jgi:hypothetical protein
MHAWDVIAHTVLLDFDSASKRSTVENGSDADEGDEIGAPDCLSISGTGPKATSRCNSDAKPLLCLVKERGGICFHNLRIQTGSRRKGLVA